MAEIILKELCYRINGLLFKVHNELGRFCREKQYGDCFEKILTQNHIDFAREKSLPMEQIENIHTNIVDFVIEEKLPIDFKAKSMITKEDYYQMQRYLKGGNYKLGLIVNFRNVHLNPLRIIRYHS